MMNTQDHALKDPAVCRVTSADHEASGSRWPRSALRVAASAQAALVFTQAVLAGQLLSGKATARASHQQLGTEIITWVALLEVVLAVLVWRPGRGSLWPLVVTAVTFAAVTVQIGMGFAGLVAVHIPLGVAVFAVNLALAIGLREPACRPETVAEE